MEMVSYAVIAAHNRQLLLSNLLDVLVKDHVATVVLDNASDPPIVVPNLVHLIHDSEQPPNLSRLWNRCLDQVLLLHADHTTPDAEFVICVLNDDLEIYPGFIAELVNDMRLKNSSVSFPSSYSGHFTGWCFGLRGSLVKSKVLRFDERLRWWWGDTLIFQQARRLAGGASAFKPRKQLNHKHPNEQTVGVLREQGRQDAETYKKIMRELSFG